MTDVRAELLKLMNATLADEAASHTWTYAAVRPLPVPPSWHAGQKVRADCSKGCQYLDKWAGGVDCLGQNFGAYGNSASAAVHLHHLDSIAELQVGDLVSFGPGGDEHLARVMQLRKPPATREPSDVVLWSDGHQGAPNRYLLSEDRRVHQLLRYPAPVLPQTEAARLRAMTGYWSWLQWRLGEGHWRGYGKSNRKVRPNVPHLIPLSWWRRFARYLRNRNSANPPTTSP